MTNPFIGWAEAIQNFHQQGQDYVIVTLIGRAGSAPRDPGSKMVVTLDESHDTIGGGELEFLLIQKSREYLLAGKTEQYLEKIPLAAKAGQCCGGSVSVLLEVFCNTRPLLAVFGAGHVATALMSIFGQLPNQVRWIDSREQPLSYPVTLAASIQTRFGRDPLDELAALPAGAQLLILTHNHQLDYELLSAALTRGDLSWIGCIGSQTKRERFFQRLQRQGFAKQEVEQIAMPVGHADVGGKLPMEVAVSIAAQLIQLEHATEIKPLRQGLDWREIQKQLSQTKEPMLPITEPSDQTQTRQETL